MNKPLVSIFCSVYNREQFIEKTILSVLNQTYTNFEFLIVDDWSTDESWKIIEKYSKIDSRIRAWKHNNIGLYEEYKFLLKNISKKSEYITWIDSDDLYINTNLEERINVFKENNKIDCILNDIQPIDEEWNLLKYNYENYFLKYDDINKILLKMFYNWKDLPISYWIIFIKKNLLLKEWLINPTVNKKYFIWDFDLICRIYNKYNIKYLNKWIYYYREHSNQITNNNELIFSELKYLFYFLFRKGYIKKEVFIFIINKVLKNGRN